jgi:hypothetical protein
LDPGRDPAEGDGRTGMEDGGRGRAGTSFDGADVDAECCVVVPDVGLVYRSLANPRAVRLERSSSSGEDRCAETTTTTTTTSAASALFVCVGRVTCVGAARRIGGGYVAFAGDSMGYVTTSLGSPPKRFSMSPVRYCDGEYVATEDGCVLHWDATVGAPKRRWTLRRLAPMVAATGKVTVDAKTGSTIRLVAVGGAAVACSSTSAVAPGDRKKSAANQAASMLKKLSSTAFGVVKTAFDQNARLGADVVAYEGEDMDEVSALERENGESRWNCAFVDAPRRYRAFIPAGHGGWFATTDNLHRVILYRLVGDKIRVKRIIKGCRDATVNFSASSLCVHKPSIRTLETYELLASHDDGPSVSASTSSVTAIDVSHLDVVRVLPTADEEGKVYLLTRDEPATKPSSSSCRYRIQTLEDVVADVSASTATQKKR